MTRRRLTALALALCAALPALFAGDVARAETPPAEHLHSATVDLGAGWGQTVWLDDQERPFDLGLVFRLPAAQPKVPGIAIPVVYAGGDAYALVDRAAARYGAPWVACPAKRILDRESGGMNVPNRQGSGASGPMQFMPGTFNANKAAAGYPGASVWDVEANVSTGVWMMSRGMWSHWGGRPGC